MLCILSLVVVKVGKNDNNNYEFVTKHKKSSLLHLQLLILTVYHFQLEQHFVM